MARGKHALLAARGRAESAHELIDRLTNELVEAKIRARCCERDAARLPDVLAELERIKAQVAANTSDALERERERHVIGVHGLETRLSRVAVILRNASDRHDDGLGRFFSIKELCEIDELLPEWTINSSMPRERRRSAGRLGRMGADVILQRADDATLREAGLRRVGERLRSIDDSKLLPPSRSVAQPKEQNDG